MPKLERIARVMLTGSILISVVSAALSLIQYFRADEDKIFLIFTTSPALSLYAGAIAAIVLAYSYFRMRPFLTRSWAALALAFSAYWLSDFVLVDYVRNYSVQQYIPQ